MQVKFVAVVFTVPQLELYGSAENRFGFFVGFFLHGIFILGKVKHHPYLL